LITLRSLRAYGVIAGRMRERLGARTGTGTGAEAGLRSGEVRTGENRLRPRRALVDDPGVGAELLTGRMMLRRLTPDDAAGLLALDSDPAVMRFLGPVKSIAEVEAGMTARFLTCHTRHPGFGYWAAEQRTAGHGSARHQADPSQAADRLIGWFGLLPVTPGDGWIDDWPEAPPADTARGGAASARPAVVPRSRLALCQATKTRESCASPSPAMLSRFSTSSKQGRSPDLGIFSRRTAIPFRVPSSPSGGWKRSPIPR
jgi:hypothetical protein